MNVNELLDTIEDALEESAGMPLSGGKRIVDVEQIRDYLDEIRSNLPVELRQAQSILSDRAQLIESANAQAHPSAVRETPRELRIKSAMPRLSSSLLIDLLIAGWLIKSSLAAREILPARATA